MNRHDRPWIRATVLALSIALTGCVSTGGLHTTGKLTDSASLKSERSLADVSLSPTAWPAQDWWVSFGDPQLSALIDEALKNNPSLAEVEARAHRAQAAADGLDAARDPQVGLDASAVGARLSNKDPIYPEYALGSFAWAKSVTAGFSWNLELWGGQRAAWEAALGRSRAAQIDAHAARIQLSVNIARAYVRLGYAFAQRDVAEAEQQRASKSLAITRPHLLDQGKIALPDQLSVGLLGRRADLVSARWQVEAAAKTSRPRRRNSCPISASAPWPA